MGAEPEEIEREGGGGPDVLQGFRCVRGCLYTAMDIHGPRLVRWLFSFGPSPLFFVPEATRTGGWGEKATMP